MKSEGQNKVTLTTGERNLHKCLVFAAIVVITKFLALYFYYEAPTNIFIKLLFAGEIFIIFKIFEYQIEKICLIFLWVFLYFSPLSLDRQVIAWRYELMAQDKTNNFKIPSGARTVLFISNFLGEQLSLTNNDSNFAGKYSSKIDKDGCFMEVTPIRTNFSLDYEVCPDAKGGIWVSSEFLDFRKRNLE